ncbi:hypothetical protein TL16_g05336 [Triparma laevis f. inornata]|uniref:Uncharacterized protein n=1 Tax=Triparma laevis f. inornata TaxID=1714386 RepID=A0A9W7E6J0_9STRA|nr:hypothetical protein TL16_g05336 [Triparma laevis f. inornata]
MSGDQLRINAIKGSAPDLIALLQGGTNPCSVDANGCTALHFGVWNGHVECVEILTANDRGTDSEGRHISALELQTDSGFTALHLAVSGSSENMLEITRFLVLCGANRFATDALGRTPAELAEECGNMKCCKFFEVTHREPPTEEECHDSLQTAREKQLVQTRRKLDISTLPVDSHGNPIIKREDKLPIPKELSIPEHHIFPQAQTAYGAVRKDGASAIKSLVMLVDQSVLNEHRRDQLANSVEENLRKEGKMVWKDSTEDEVEKRAMKGKNARGRRSSIIK